MASNPKEIVNGAVDGEKALGVAWGFEPPHLPLPLPGGLMGDFGTIVGRVDGCIGIRDIRPQIRQRRTAWTLRRAIVSVLAISQRGYAIGWSVWLGLMS